MIFKILAQVDQSWHEGPPVTIEGVIGGAVILAVAAFFLKRWSHFCDVTFRSNRKFGMAVFLSPFVAFTAFCAYRITADAHFHIADEPGLTFLVWFFFVGVAVAFWLGFVSVISEMFERE